MALPRLKVKRVLPKKSNRKEISIVEKPTIKVIEVPKEVVGPQGLQGPKGEMGIQGVSGSVPEHEVSRGQIRFKNPDGSWGKWITVSSAGGNIANVVNYKKLSLSSNYNINKNELIWGLNIFGINATAPITITLPSNIENQKVIVIKDEGGNSSANNITVRGEN